MDIKFTVAIPAFKGRYLLDCIKSILDQTYQNFELVIVNDCSPDNLEEVMSGINDPRIRYFKNEKNIGAENVVDNWNKCLIKAVGEYFLLMGDDDLLQPDFLDSFLKVVEKYPHLDVFHCRSFLIDGESNIIGVTPSLPEFETVYDLIWNRFKHRPNFISDFVFRREVLERLGGFFKLPLAWASDDITSYLVCGNKGIAHVNKPVFCYRQSDITLSRSGNAQMKLNAIAGQSRWIDDFLEHSIPDNAIDKALKKMISREKGLYIRRKKLNTISYSLSQGKFLRQYLYWWRNRKRNGLSLKELLFLLIEYFKRKEARRN